MPAEIWKALEDARGGRRVPELFNRKNYERFFMAAEFP